MEVDIKENEDRSSGGGGGKARNGKVYTFGLNANGQLGTKDVEMRITPAWVKHMKDTEVKQVAAGSRFTLFLSNHGSVYSTGKGDDGALGNGTNAMSVVPSIVSSLEGVVIVKLSARGSHALALAQDGRVYSWGKADDGQLGFGAPFIQRNRPGLISTLTDQIIDISAGRVHSAAISRDGKLFTWGNGEDGATGQNNADIIPYPTIVSTLFQGYLVEQVACGSRHTLCVARYRTRSISNSSSLFSFGSNSYGQLGLGDTNNRFVPTQVDFSSSSSFVDFSSICCGYRHSCAILLPSKTIYAWGWNSYGQTGTGYGLSNVLVPTKIENLPKDATPVFLAAGGRHTLVCLNHAGDEQRLWAFGRGDEGALGTGLLDSIRVPERVQIYGQNVLHAACGWGHSVVVCGSFGTMKSFGTLKTEEQEDSQIYGMRTPVHFKSSRGNLDSNFGDRKISYVEWTIQQSRLFFSMGNLDGAFAQFLNTVILFILMSNSLNSRAHFSDLNLVSYRVLPAAGLTVFGSNIFFALWSMMISRNRRLNSLPSVRVTALPHGLNTVIFFAFATLVIIPVVEETGDPMKGYRAGLFSCFMLGLLEVPLIFFVSGVRRFIPRAALKSASAGVALMFIATTFSMQIFQSPLLGIAPFMIILIGFGAGMKFPFRIPSGLIAMLLGVCLVWISSRVPGLSTPPLPSPDEKESAVQNFDDDQEQLRFTWPILGFSDLVIAFSDIQNYRHLSVVLPMLVINLVSNLSCVEAAASVGDEYDVKIALLADAVFTMLGALLGNPVPTCLYLGFSAFKGLGALGGYSAMNGIMSLALGVMNGVAILTRYVPETSGVGLLLWIGVMVVTQAFSQDERHQYQSHAAAVIIGILPAIASWGFQLVKLVLISACEVSSCHASNLYVKQSLVAIDSKGSHIYGMIALSRGWLISSVFLSSTVTHVIEREFLLASGWMLLAAFFSLIGFVHSYDISQIIFDFSSETTVASSTSSSSSSSSPDHQEMDMNIPLQFAVSYFICAMMLLVAEFRERDKTFSEWISKLCSCLGFGERGNNRRKRREDSIVQLQQQDTPLPTETTKLITISNN